MNLKEFQKLVKTGKHLVDFYTDSCSPCKILAKILPELQDKINIIKIDAVTSSELSSEFSIAAVPTVLFFKDGVVIQKVIGLKSKEFLVKIIESL